MELNKEQQITFKKQLLETYDAFYKFCKENNLKFYAAWGTAIGAVRHHGIIPWDDDIDVLMPEEDYLRFCSLKESVKGSGYEIIDTYTRNYYCFFSKFASTSNSIWEFKGHPIIFGTYIDVFPIYDVSGSYEEIKRVYNRYAKLANYFYIFSNKTSFREACKSLSKGQIINFLKQIIKLVIFPVALLVVRNTLQRCFTLDKNGTHYYISPSNNASSLKSHMFLKSWFSQVTEVPFEGRLIPLPVGYDEMLRCTFGDYMTPPPESERVSHHAHYYINLDRRVTIEEANKIIENNEA